MIRRVVLHTVRGIKVPLHSILYKDSNVKLMYEDTETGELYETNPEKEEKKEKADEPS